MAYVHQAVATGDPSFYGLAGQALDRAEELAPGDATTLVARGTLQLSLHQFADALASGEAALAARADDRDALAVVVDASVETGRYDDAATTLQRLVDIRPSLAAPLPRVVPARAPRRHRGRHRRHATGRGRRRLGLRHRHRDRLPRRPVLERRPGRRRQHPVREGGHAVARARHRRGRPGPRRGREGRPRRRRGPPAEGRRPLPHPDRHHAARRPDRRLRRRADDLPVAGVGRRGRRPRGGPLRGRPRRSGDGRPAGPGRRGRPPHDLHRRRPRLGAAPGGPRHRGAPPCAGRPAPRDVRRPAPLPRGRDPGRRPATRPAPAPRSTRRCRRTRISRSRWRPPPGRWPPASAEAKGSGTVCDPRAAR